MSDIYAFGVLIFSTIMLFEPKFEKDNKNLFWDMDNQMMKNKLK